MARLRPSASPQQPPRARLLSPPGRPTHPLSIPPAARVQATGGHSRTFGALDTVQATLMAPHLTSIYVSGWQSSSTASTSNEPGPDFVRHQITRVVA